MKLWNRLTNRGRIGSYALGVHFGSSSIRLVGVERLRRGFSVRRCGESSFPDGIRFQGQFDSSSKTTCLRTLQTALDMVQPETKGATIGLDGRGVLVKRIPIDPWLEGEELHEQILWETEQLLVDPLDQFVIDYDIQEINETGREALLAIVRRRILDDYGEMADKGGLDPVCMDVDLFALSNAYEHVCRARIEEPITLLDVEPGCLRCVRMDHGAFLFGRTQGAPSPPEKWEDLLQTALHHAPATGQKPVLGRIVVTGERNESSALVPELTSRYGSSVELAHPFRNVKIDASLKREQFRENAPAFMIGFGLALRGATEI